MSRGAIGWNWYHRFNSETEAGPSRLHTRNSMERQLFSSPPRYEGPLSTFPLQHNHERHQTLTTLVGDEPPSQLLQVLRGRGLPLWGWCSVQNENNFTSGLLLVQCSLKSAMACNTNFGSNTAHLSQSRGANATLTQPSARISFSN